MGEMFWYVKCINKVRDPTKDQSIVSLYLFCITGLLLWAVIRSQFFQNLMGRLRHNIRILQR